MGYRRRRRLVTGSLAIHSSTTTTPFLLAVCKIATLHVRSSCSRQTRLSVFSANQLLRRALPSPIPISSTEARHLPAFPVKKLHCLSQSLEAPAKERLLALYSSP